MLRWLFLDLNSYFASVEQELKPHLRGKPVAVVPLLADTTCCIAASYEAKAFGIKTGTSVGDAKKLCPQIQFIEADHEQYVIFHEKIVTAIESCLPVTAVMSIDEMACKLMGNDRDEKNAVALAKKIKKTIYKDVGNFLKCSIGIAPNRFLAKVASDIQKPDGLTIIHPEDIPKKLLHLKLNDFPGIGHQMLKRVNRYGVYSTEQLYKLSKAEMRKIWGGIQGERFWHWIKGDDGIELPNIRNRSIGHSHVLPPEFRNQKSAYAVSQKLLHKAGQRLRKMNYWAAGLSCFIRAFDPKTKASAYWSDNSRIIECQDTLTLLEALEQLWKNAPQNILDHSFAVGVTLYDLIEDNQHTLSLSMFNETKRVNLAKAMDGINSKYGKTTVYFGGIHEVKSSAPTRIAFTSIPDVEI